MPINNIRDLYHNLNFICKQAEWMICLVICIIVSDVTTWRYHVRLRDLAIFCGGSYFIVTFSLFLVYIFDTTNILYELIILSVGAIVFFATGIDSIVYIVDDPRGYVGDLLISGFAVACAVIMLIDWIYLFKKIRKKPT